MSLAYVPCMKTGCYLRLKVFTAAMVHSAALFVT